MDAMLAALAEPNRKRIVDLLRDGACPVGQIVERLNLHQPQVSKHLRVLSDAGLVEVRPVAQQRFYSVRPQAFHEFASWVDTYRLLWEEQMDRLDVVLQEVQQQEVQQEDKRHAGY